MRFRVTVLATIVALMAIVAGMVIAVTLSEHGNNAVPLVSAMFGMVGLIVPVLLALLKIEDTNNKITNGFMDNKIKGNVKTAMAERAEEFKFGVIPDERKEDEE